MTAEAIDAKLPVVVVPWANSSLASHPLYEPALRSLHEWGVQILSAAQSQAFPWKALGAVLGEIRDDFEAKKQLLPPG
ncbi:hypothetical protein [Streptomyces sp. NPDC055400]